MNNSHPPPNIFYSLPFSRTTMNTLWIEKYRPNNLNEIIGQTNVINKLKKYVHEENLPHLLFVGKKGVGKTSTALALAKEIYGDNWKENIKEFNSSEERGIQAIREDVKETARTTTLNKKNYRLIYLEEADSFSDDAQTALRRTVEKYSDNARFILSCTNSSKIIDPIRSRCVNMYFRPINKENVKKWINRIEDKEELNITEDAVQTLIRAGKGNLQKVTNLLQISAQSSEDITEEAVQEALKVGGKSDIKELIMKAFRGDFMDVREDLYELMIDEGMSGEEIIERVNEELYSIPMDRGTKIQIIKKLGEIEYNMVEGNSDRFHLENLFSYLSAIGDR